MKTPLAEITVKCSECGEETRADDVNADNVRYHTGNGHMVRFPSIGLNPEYITKLNAMYLLCECCQEEAEENS